METQLPLNAFCAYAQQDTPLWEEFRCHLSVLERQGLIASWYTWKFDKEIESEEVDEAFSHAEIFVFFINSKSIITHKKLIKAAEKQRRGQALIFPILSGNARKYGPATPSLPIFKQLTFFPDKSKDLTSWGDTQEALCAQTRYILSLTQSYQAIKFLPEVQRLKALRESERKARRRALSEWSEYQMWNKGRGRPLWEELLHKISEMFPDQLQERDILLMEQYYGQVVSSQKSGADQLVNLGQKGSDKSSSADLPRNIEKIRQVLGSKIEIEIEMLSGQTEEEKDEEEP